jgi:hypothetical protein
MLRVGLQLGASVLDLKLPDAIVEGVERDGMAKKLYRQVAVAATGGLFPLFPSGAA